MRMNLSILTSLLVLLTSCDDVPDESQKTVERRIDRGSVSITSITPLLPARVTHLAVDSTGQIFWLQETDRRQSDAVFRLGAGDVPEATGITPERVLRALNVPGTTGAIQSICAGLDDYVYFYFAGGTQREPVHAIGRFRSSDAQTPEILVGPGAMLRDTGMGVSIDLARGTLFASPRDRAVWVWVRHLDRSSLTRLDLSDLANSVSSDASGASVPRSDVSISRPDLLVPRSDVSVPRPDAAASVPPADPGRLVRLFDTVRTDTNDALPLVRPEYHLSSAPDGSLVLIDTWLGAIWRIDAQTGRATVVRSLVGLSRAVSAPMFDGDGRLRLMFGAGPIMLPRVEAMITDPPVRTTYPALLTFNNAPPLSTGGAAPPWSGPVDATAGDELSLPPDANRATFRIRPTDAEFGMKSWVAYEASDGNLVRIKLDD